ncbi:EGF domain-specific O-linked N-acetylglucosamine transferase-like isoform X2 [Pomacea canaliculata]|uniref:EGF domain-specific O-linked N-acetylglucosamine transferase-like isoform X2 n=1 Tax=Pomacea canaliculata TaxID=400727 RepID=UPI000D73EB41|nr:EGF domain-specific O-linked N-acetylglucosamine transferase-like isoform X2 [Pomacea canaliculata]
MTKYLCSKMKCQHHLMMVLIVSWSGGGFAAYEWNNNDMAIQHVAAFLHNNPHLKQLCLKDDGCPYKEGLRSSVGEGNCWGYENDCNNADKLPDCPGDSQNWAPDKTSQKQEFWNTADFGYVQQHRKERKLYCRPGKPDDSSLECTDHLRMCHASNIFIDLSTAGLSHSTNPYREDVLKKNQIGGHCHLNKELLQSQLDHKSPLQSWAAEMEHYTELVDLKCDIFISRPTYLIKLDATVNMYHHFCDFVNLYISQHINNSFNLDVNIIIWDTSGHNMNPMFIETWKAFTKHPLMLLKDFDGKRVCIKQAVFSLLARMRRGLYYNMPLIPGCYGSSLIRSFSHHLIHRLRIPQNGPLESKIRVTLLTRSTQYRQILNQDQLLRSLQTDVEMEVQQVDFNRTVPFLKQIEISHNTDILIGMHGAGLTHMLFQPDWGVIFELYNCEDAGCYLDLSRLRGIRYLTWKNKQLLTQEDEGHHPTLGAHAKFTNYAFDVDEFMRLVRLGAAYVKHHPAFHAAHTARFFSTELQQEKQHQDSITLQKQYQQHKENHGISGSIPPEKLNSFPRDDL